MTHQLNAPAPAGAAFLARTAVVIPALNEAPCVADTVLAWRMPGVTLVRGVDNGSTDRTAARAHDVGAEVLLEPGRAYGPVV